MPRYESIKTIVGTPKDVDRKLNAYFASNDRKDHPNATLISTALSVHTYETLDEDEMERLEKKREKALKKPKPAASGSESGESSAPPAEPQPAVALPMKRVTIETMTATVGLVFP